MRELYEEIQEYYLLNEALSKEPSSPIETKICSVRKNIGHSTNLTRYVALPTDITHHNKETGETRTLGASHEVKWETMHPADQMNNRERMASLHDALHLHKHHIKSNTNVGDVIKNKPDYDSENSSKNRRSKIYKKIAGFGDIDADGYQYGTVKAYPQDHHEKHLRGQKYLDPDTRKGITTRILDAVNKSRLINKYK